MHAGWLPAKLRKRSRTRLNIYQHIYQLGYPRADRTGDQHDAFTIAA